MASAARPTAAEEAAAAAAAAALTAEMDLEQGMGRGMVPVVIPTPPPPPPPPLGETSSEPQSSSSSAVTAAAAAAAVPAPLDYANTPPPEYFEHTPPPSYHVAAELPSYEEAERTKGKYLSMDPSPMGMVDLGPPDHRHHHHHQTGLPGITLMAFPSGMSDSSDDDAPDTSLLGNDFVFFTAFITAFLFNWVGFLLLMCFCHTIAARYGALAGFGLSLTKWTLIVKRSTELASNDNSWLWWLIMAFGLLICVRAIVQYLHIKRSWAALTSSARERLFFFY